MAMTGALSRKVTFKRAVAGTLNLAGAAAGVKNVVAAAVAGVLTFTGALARKVTFKRAVGGTLTFAGTGSKTYLLAKRTVSGVLTLAGNVSAPAIRVVKKGLNRFGLGLRVD